MEIKPGTLKPAIRVVVLMLVVTGIAYPLALVAIGQSALPFQSNGSILELNGKEVGSRLVAQEFSSPKFFHPRPAVETASGVDPHITPDDAYSQAKGVSQATGIPENYLVTMIDLNIERNRSANLVAFAPDHVNVLELNIELARQYPDTYAEFLGTGQG
ncbi:potassium-transporting ATPase subunit C [Nitrososphaera viennensis]|uniref:Potassium translocating ATPase, subunit C n=2 Tax=Nitrososphaera viennensis TaxID=1034015 RepID=A0A060HKF0_9ARCH|nr:potassium-transporting ATPase subunit C [Nitrososphaera viennensis]AIC16989.1 potassium translocating ATPase, subunit C [Nitrososphaera viennensis EN76]UVS68889.1 potassium-transporting ATPase subunit C [Nitrososphaera viennensis]